jgi:succinyl-diaminopimelate desuccinylase
MSNLIESSANAVELAQSLIRISSVSKTKGQQDIFDHCEAIFRSAGFEVRVDGHRARRFLLATVGDQSGSNLLFACHVDTVPVGATSTWRFDALAGHIDNGSLYGRGASDMKGGIASAICAAISAAKDGFSCAILLTTDEEIGCVGATASLDFIKNLNIGAIVIPESTENKISLGHRGAFWLRLQAQGRSAHGSTPELGESALLKMAEVLLGIQEKMPRNVDGYLGSTSVNIGTFSAGTATNVVAAEAKATLDIRYSDPGEPDSLMKWFSSNYPGVSVETDLLLESLQTDGDNPWVQSLFAKAKQRKPVGYFTDGAVFQQVLKNVPIVIWGPGDPGSVHAPDEAISIECIHDATRMYREVIKHWKS